jgi:hypothetical protein
MIIKDSDTLEILFRKILYSEDRTLKYEDNGFSVVCPISDYKPCTVECAFFKRAKEKSHGKTYCMCMQAGSSSPLIIGIENESAGDKI